MVLTGHANISVYERVLASAQETITNGCHKLGFKAMGTWCQITFDPPSPFAAKEFKRAVLRWVADFEAKYSRFLPDSLISRINAAAGAHWVEIDPETERIFALCEELIFITSGVFDPTSLPLIQRWNWKAQPPVIPDDAAIRAARELVGWHNVELKPGAIFLPREGMCLDLGGIGKEYAVDCAARLAAAHGIHCALVDFGQDVHARGTPPGKEAWHIGLEDPKRPGTCWASVGARDTAVATSGDYLRCFEIGGRRYGHILDPRTGYPVNNGCRAVTVIAPSCTLAGVLSTTAFILGATEGIKLIETLQRAEGCILTETSRSQTRRFDAHVIQSH
jgi:thiamine biosynthesis lipoprotein